MLRHGWRTGAIVPELETEIRIINTEQYMHSLTWQQALTGLLERMQVTSSSLSGAGNCCLARVLGLGGDRGTYCLACVLENVSSSSRCKGLVVPEVQWKLGVAEAWSAGLPQRGVAALVFPDVSGCGVEASVAGVDEGTAGDQVTCLPCSRGLSGAPRPARGWFCNQFWGPWCGSCWPVVLPGAPCPGEDAAVQPCSLGRWMGLKVGREGEVVSPCAGGELMGCHCSSRHCRWVPARNGYRNKEEQACGECSSQSHCPGLVCIAAWVGRRVLGVLPEHLESRVAPG